MIFMNILWNIETIIPDLHITIEQSNVNITKWNTLSRSKDQNVERNSSKEKELFITTYVKKNQQSYGYLINIPKIINKP